MDDERIIKLKEYAKIVADTPYALKTYLQTYDNTQKKHVPLELFPDQERLIRDYEQYNENITRKYRQAGVSTVTAAWVSKLLQTAKPEKPERILVIANKRDTAIEMANKIRFFLKQWPEWMNVGFSKEKDSESRFKLNNGCEVKAVATSNDALRGYTPTILIFDEAAYIEAGPDFWSASMASLSTGGKIILISTPNGFDPIYQAVYSQAEKGLNTFHITDLRWFKDPRYSKDLRWVKVKDIVHYLVNRQDYNDSEITYMGRYDGNYEEMFKMGYKPVSSWFEKMCSSFKYDKRMIAQELEADFLGSGDAVISSEIQENIAKNMVEEPMEKYMAGYMWQWKEPVLGHRYIMGVDVSSGESDDYSSICVIDFDAGEQVLEYVGKMPPDDLANIVYKWAILYEAFVNVDITGGMGIATVRKLQEMGYRDLFIEGFNIKDVWAVKNASADKIPGIKFNNKRTQIVAAFEEALRHGFIVKSTRLLHELTTFVFLNGRPDHMKGTHDDAIMAMSIALYTGDVSFAELKRNELKNKAMMESWTMADRSYDTNKSFYSYGTTLDPLGAMQTDPSFYHRGNPNTPTKEMYKEYGWLFGKKYSQRR